MKFAIMGTGVMGCGWSKTGSMAPEAARGSMTGVTLEILNPGISRTTSSAPWTISWGPWSSRISRSECEGEAAPRERPLSLGSSPKIGVGGHLSTSGRAVAPSPLGEGRGEGSSCSPVCLNSGEREVSESPRGEQKGNSSVGESRGS